MMPAPARTVVPRRLTMTTMGARERRLRNHWLRRVIGLMLLATALSVIHVWSRMEVLHTRYAITDVQQRIDRLAKTAVRVESLVAALQSAERLTKVAREELRLMAPSAGQVIVVQGGRP